MFVCGAFEYVCVGIVCFCSSTWRMCSISVIMLNLTRNKDFWYAYAKMDDDEFWTFCNNSRSNMIDCKISNMTKENGTTLRKSKSEQADKHWHNKQVVFSFNWIFYCAIYMCCSCCCRCCCYILPFAHVVKVLSVPESSIDGPYKHLFIIWRIFGDR